VRSLLKRGGGISFGWSGTVSINKDAANMTVQRRDICYVVIDVVEADYQEYDRTKRPLEAANLR
jgi:hypothetical protein